MMENPRNPISDLHVAKFPDTSDFQCWKTNFETEVCSCSGCLTVAMLWIQEVEADFELLDAKTASALKRIITNQYFRRINVEEPHAQTCDRFPRGRQIANVIYEHFRATGAHDTALDLSDLFDVSLQGDDIQDFATRWDQSSWRVCTR